MVKNHQPRMSAPNCWPTTRKGTKFLPKTSPGPYGLRESVPLTLVVTEMLKLARTTKEAKAIICKGKILVNKKPRKDIKHPVGLMDVVDIPETGSHYRMLLSRKGKFILHPISSEEAAARLCKIKGKTVIKGGKVQLNLHDGSNIKVDSKEYKPGDTIILTTGGKEIKEHIRLEKGCFVMITGGNKVSTVGRMEGIKSFKASQPDNVLVSTKDGIIETRKEYAFAIGKESPAISLPQNE